MKEIIKIKNKNELFSIIKRITEESYLNNECDLNHLDVSEVKDMSHIFEYSKFNGDISNWDVSNVENMDRMFAHSRFNGDISNWNVSKVKSMRYLFCYADLRSDISKWDVSNVEDMTHAFSYSRNKWDVSSWNIKKVKSMKDIFKGNEYEKPYWSEIESKEERISAYKKHKLNEKLSLCLTDESLMNIRNKI